MRTAARIHVPWFLEIPLVTVIYALCAAVLGASLFPAALLLLWASRRFILVALLERTAPAAGGVALLCLIAGASLFVFFFCGLLLMGLCVRALSLGVRQGRHAAFSATMIFWTMLNSIHTMAFRIILPIVPAGYFTTMYFRLAGCKLGRDVRITTPALLDPYLISIGDGTVIGGDAVLSAHIFSRGKLYLAPIRIGRDCEIGAHALVCAGVSVGDGATVGIRACIPRGRKIPPNARISAAV
jgi:acetyltransferase-like isoleucine patch superfamily enzyme